MTGVFLAAGWVLPVSAAPIRDGAVAVEDGRIAWVGPAETAERSGAEVRDLGAGVLLPGLVNAHCHLELSHLAGAVAAGSGFSEWVGALVSARSSESGEQVRAAAGSAALGMAAAGTAAVGDVSNRLEHLDLLAAAGLRAVVYHELIGWDPARAEAVLAAAEARVAALKALPGVAVELAAHAPHSVSPELFAALRRRGGPASLHLAESPDEERFLRSGDGPWCGFLESRGLGHVPFVAPGTSAVRYADSLGVLHPGLLAVHCVQATPDDCRLLAERGVSVAVCPRSNRFLGVGLPPVAEMLAAGVNVCVGTDSLASSPSLDVLADLRALHAELPDMPPSRLLEMATVNGARALGLGDLGALAPGKTAALAFLAAQRRIKDPLAYLLHSTVRATRLVA